MRFFSLLAIAFLTLHASSCASTLPDFRTFKDPRQTPEYKKMMASGATVDFFECAPFLFKAGRPKPGEDLISALEDFQSERFEGLYECLALYANTPSFRFEINGFSDPSECHNDCAALSNRRAELVKSTLLKMHFPPNKIVCSVGHGEKFVLDKVDTDRNRRVEIYLNIEGRPDNYNCEF